VRCRPLLASQRSWLSMVRGSSDTSIAPHHPNASCARIWTARGVDPAMVVTRTGNRRRSRDLPWWEASSIAPSHPNESSVPLLRRAPWPGAPHRSWRPRRQTVSGPPVAGGRSIAMLSPPPEAWGAGGSRAPAHGVRERCMDGELHAVTCPTSCMARLEAIAAGVGQPVEENGPRSVGPPCARVQQLTPVSRSAACRPLAARVVKGADWDRRGTASAALTVGSGGS